MSIDCALVICDDSLGLSDSTTILTDDYDHTVDFGTKFEGGERLNPKCFGYGSGYDSDQEEISFTERTTGRTKHHETFNSQSTHNNSPSRKRQKHVEPDSSNSTFNSEDLFDEKADLLNGTHLFKGKEIFSQWILEFVSPNYFTIHNCFQFLFSKYLVLFPGNWKRRIWSRVEGLQQTRLQRGGAFLFTRNF